MSKNAHRYLYSLSPHTPPNIPPTPGGLFGGVCGDLPPMDFVAANGQAAGFNIALLTEIANRAQVNFELIQIETGARAISLSSGKVDAVFWTLSVTCNTCGETIYEKIDGTLATETYCSANNTRIKLKSDK